MNDPILIDGIYKRFRILITKGNTLFQKSRRVHEAAGPTMRSSGRCAMSAWKYTVADTFGIIGKERFRQVHTALK